MVTVAPPIVIQTRYPRASRDYQCKNCGGLIAKGVGHEELVVRIGTRKYKDPLQHWRIHSDCQAPWWHPWAPRKLTTVGALPSRIGEKAHQESLAKALYVAVKHEAIGHIEWLLPPEMTERIFQSKREDALDKALTEMEDVLMLITKAVVEVAGNRKRSMQLSHAINAISFVATGREVPKKRVRKKKEVATTPD